MHTDDDSPLILGFVADLYFAVRIESVAESLDFRVKWIERAEDIAPLEDRVTEHQYAEHLAGPGAVLLESITQWKPALIIFDLGNTAIPWRDWISLLTSVPATRRIPVLCFGSHMDVETMQAARAAGAKIVLARSRFVSEMPELIQKHARLVDRQALQETCHEALSAKAVQGLEEFNRSEYFEAHEYLEEAWMQETSLGRDLYRAILQVAVAYYQIERRNYKGAMKMFLRMRQWLDPLPEHCRGVNIEKLRHEAHQVYEQLVALGPERIAEFDQGLLRPVEYRVERP